MAEKYTITRIKSDTLAKIRKMAQNGYRSVPQQIDLMVTAFEMLGAVDVSVNAHPAGAEGVPVVRVRSQAA